MGTASNNDLESEGCIKYCTFKIQASKTSVYQKVAKIHETYLDLEKDLISDATQIPVSTISDYAKVMGEFEDFFEPVMRRVEQEYFPMSRYYHKSSDDGKTPRPNPKNVFFFPDKLLFSFPFEHLRCVRELFGGLHSPEAIVGRDMALHVLCARNSLNGQVGDARSTVDATASS